VEAPFYRRVSSELSEATPPELTPLASTLIENLSHLKGSPTHPPSARSANTRDGRGIIFVAHDGQVTPSGFLPVPVGSVKEQPLTLVYRDAPLMRRLRESEGLGGRCRFCSYREKCGGSRARSYATCGDTMAEDPACAAETADM
jgi:radical SAM protein with 4Fe4S-binding SPASM domain